ncbi:hypothetical protein EVAR_73287_1 [Eumeta japonica]|uniref:Uncharacterized protein n=1 Tax=Eumeta variegata TaxID=151549 RepID=A0A4C1T0M9_EUMVA|nr:hypothetical protein EVAR_73287_1 [Eumeta japonica]
MIIPHIKIYQQRTAKTTRGRKDLPFHSYVLSVIKNTTKAERMACAIVGLLVLGCIGLIVYFTVFFNTYEDVADDPADWNITRQQWYAQHFETTTISESFRPVRLVIIGHSVSAECFTFIVCAAELRSLQGWFISYHGWDIP